MGNCFKAQNNDDISLLRGSEGQESVEQALGPPPPYQACFVVSMFVLVSTSRLSVSSFVISMFRMLHYNVLSG